MLWKFASSSSLRWTIPVLVLRHRHCGPIRTAEFLLRFISASGRNLQPGVLSGTSRIYIHLRCNLQSLHLFSCFVTLTSLPKFQPLLLLTLPFFPFFSGSRSCLHAPHLPSSRLSLFCSALAIAAGPSVLDSPFRTFIHSN